jgi:hypothetical protein
VVVPDSAPGLKLVYVECCVFHSFMQRAKSLSRCLPWLVPRRYWAEPVLRQGVDIIMLECLPLEACLGGFGSPCKTGYTGRKCGFCAPHFFRENTFCKACPTQAPVILALGVVALCCVAALIARYGRHFSGMTASRLLSDFLLVSMSVIGFDVHWSQRVKDFVESVKNTVGYLATYTNFVKPEYVGRWALAHP